LEFLCHANYAEAEMGELAMLTKDAELSVTSVFPPDVKTFLSVLAERSH
jgi:hypothetical protein